MKTCNTCGTPQGDVCLRIPGASFDGEHCVCGGNDETVSALAALTEPVKITRANVDTLLDTGMMEVRMKSGAWWAIRRNGKTKLWKTQPLLIRIPYKYGFRGYGALVTDDFDGATGALNPAHYRVKPPAAVDERLQRRR